MWVTWKINIVVLVTYAHLFIHLFIVCSNNYVGYVNVCILLFNISRARGVMVIVAGSGHGNTSSNPGRDSSHFT